MHHDLGRTIEASGKGDQSDGGGTFAGQLPGGHVGSETYFGEDLLNPGSSIGGDAGHPVNNPGDGLIRNAGQRCDVMDGQVLFFRGQPHRQGE